MNSIPGIAPVSPGAAGQRIAVWTVSVLLAAFFLAAGVTLLLNPAWVAESFASWGYPGWLRVAAGIVAACGGLGLLSPRLVAHAACILAILLSGAMYTQLAYEQEAGLLISLPLVGLLALVGVVRHPRRVGMRRLRAATNAFADLEMERQRRWQTQKAQTFGKPIRTSPLRKPVDVPSSH
jgi:uncharacterized membrane protein YphA (DoxX/SURF4 family)